MTGFNLPPGCTTRHIDEAMGVDAQCDVCKLDTDNCICPECPRCGCHGEPDCYDDFPKVEKDSHGLKLSNAQHISRTRYEISELKDQIADHEHYLQWLEEQQYAEQYRKLTDQE
jgi:hypothetical protein